MHTERDLSLGLALLAGFGLVCIKTAQAQHTDEPSLYDTNGPTCSIKIGNTKIAVSAPNPSCIDYHPDYTADTVPAGKVTVTLHRPPMQSWRPSSETVFASTTYFLAPKEKDCAIILSLADKGNGYPAKYICENAKEHKPFAELQCDGNRQLQNCYGLRYKNGIPLHVVLPIKASLQ